MPRASDIQAIKKLRLRWLYLLVIAIALLLAGYYLFVRSWGSGQALRWLLASGLILGYQLAMLWFDLEKNTPVGKGALLPSLGTGTWLSLVRLLSIGLLAGFLVRPRPPGWLIWLPFILNLISNFSDLLDGYYARLSGSVTNLGQKLDMDLDGRGMLVATLLAFHYGQVAWWFLLVGFARYLYVFGLWLRQRLGLRIEKLQPSVARRTLAGTQMVFATAMLAPFFSPPETTFASALFMLPFMGHFIYDWLQISGRRKILKRFKAWITSSWLLVDLPFALRTLTVALLLWRLIAGADQPLFLTVEFLLALALGLGLSGRVVAALILIETGFRLQGQSSSLSDWMILLAGTGLLYLGTGPYSLWTPEDKWITQRLGEKKK